MGICETVVTFSGNVWDAVNVLLECNAAQKLCCAETGLQVTFQLVVRDTVERRRVVNWDNRV